MKETYMEAIRDCIREEMRKDNNLFMIGEDVGPYGGEMGLSQGLWKEFGDDRMRDAPISEASIVGLALGAALSGCKAIAEIPFCDFIGVPMDQIFNQASKMRYMFGGKARIPLVIRTPIGGYQNAAAQHSQCMEAWFMHIPGIKVVMPSNAYDAKGLLRTALNDNNPVIFFEHKKLYQIKGEVPGEEYSIPFGKANIVNVGSDITVIATSYMVDMAVKGLKELENDGISVEIIDPRTLVPFDEDTIIKSVQKTGRALVVHEAWKTGGIGAEIASRINEKCWNDLKAPVSRIGAKDVPIPFSPVLEEFVLPSTQKIVQEIKSVIKG